MVIKLNTAIDESARIVEYEIYQHNEKYMASKEELIHNVFISECPYSVSRLEKYFAYQLSKYGLGAPSILEHTFSLNISLDSKYAEYKDNRNFSRELSEIIGRGGSQADQYESILSVFEKHSGKAATYRKLQFSNCLNVFDCILLDMIIKNVPLKRCENCGKFFVPSRSDMIYCENISPQDEGKSCREYGKYRDYLEKNRTDEATRLYRSIYNTMQNKSRRCGHKNQALVQAVADFKKMGNEWRAEIKKGHKTIAEYIEWLKAVKEKKVP